MHPRHTSQSCLMSRKRTNKSTGPHRTGLSHAAVRVHKGGGRGGLEKVHTAGPSRLGRQTARQSTPLVNCADRAHSGPPASPVVLPSAVLRWVSSPSVPPHVGHCSARRSARRSCVRSPNSARRPRARLPPPRVRGHALPAHSAAGARLSARRPRRSQRPHGAPPSLSRGR